jgi:hypothetical protein
VKRHTEWISYEEAAKVLELRENSHRWVQHKELCPDCEKKHLPKKEGSDATAMSNLLLANEPG